MSETPEHLIRLNPEQLDAVTTIHGPLLILAGAGSGKTRVLTRRIAHLLYERVEPENVLAVTFTNKAAHEMKERVAELVGEAGKRVWVSTFHSSCCRILRAEAEALGYTNRFAIYDDDDQHRMVSQIIADLGYDRKVVTPGSLLSRIDHYKNRTMTVEQLVDEHRAHGSEPLVRVWRAYEEGLRASDALDFNDLIGKTVQLFETREDILQKYREKFQYVLVDEYQDTNRAQYRLLRMIADGHRNLAVVGDDDQSIYAFRGADISNILNFEKDFPETKTVRLERNYRSTENILAVANAVVALNEERIKKRLWTDVGSGARVQFHVADDIRAEAKLVAQAVHQLRRKGHPASDIAIIYRTNATSQPFEAALREVNIPYQVVGGRQFYSRREIRDALSFVRLILNPADDAALLRVINVPPRGIGATALTRLRTDAATRGEPLLKAARSFARGADRAARSVATFVALIDALTEISHTASLPAFVQQVLERSGYAAMLHAEDTPESRSRVENLNQLLRDAAQFEPPTPTSTPDERVGAWLDRISLAGADEQIPDGGVVTMMTVHTSKGLEYPIVFVVHVVEGQFPHSRSAEEPGGVEEERRLAYVAFTRAQKRLFITRARNGLSYDPVTHKAVTSPVAPSRFLFGVPEEACDGDLPVAEDAEKAKPTAKRPVAPGREAQARLSTMLSHLQRGRATQQEAAPLQVEALPSEDEILTIEVESLEQLRSGVRVIHEVLGVGTVVLRSGPTLHVRFASGTRSLSATDRRLLLVRER